MSCFHILSPQLASIYTKDGFVNQSMVSILCDFEVFREGSHAKTSFEEKCTGISSDPSSTPSLNIRGQCWDIGMNAA